MCADGIVRHSQCHPYHSFAACAAAHHLHDPRLLRVADGEGLSLAVISVGLGESGHHLYRLARCLRALQSNIDERSIVECTRRIHHLLATAKGGLANGHLPFVDVSHHVVGLFRFRYLSVILIRVPVAYVSHRALRVLACREVAEGLKHAVVVGAVGTHHRTIYTGFLSNNVVGTCHGVSASHEHEREKYCFLHSYLIYIIYISLAQRYNISSTFQN